MGTQSGYCACSHRVLNVYIGTVGTHTGIVRARMGLAGRRHVEQSFDLAVRREVCCVVFVHVVCYSARHRPRRGDERLVYREPEIPLTLVWDPPHGAPHGALGVPT